MPCICYGAISGEEEMDRFLESKNGKDVMEHLTNAALIIKTHKISTQCNLRDSEFRQMFVKAFLHMLIGCDEQGKSKINK